MFTRQIYDKGAYAQDLYEWERPSEYLLLDESTHRGDRTCFQEIPEMLAENKTLKISRRNDMANIESDLRNLNRPASKDPLSKYPFIKPEYFNAPKYPVCSRKTENFNIIYPKLDGNQWNREKSIHVPRFESLCLNSQQLNRIRSNNVIGTNTRLYNRDTHVPVIPKLYNHTNMWTDNCPNSAINSCPSKWVIPNPPPKALRRDMKYILDSGFKPEIKQNMNLELKKQSMKPRNDINPSIQNYVDMNCQKCVQ